MMVKFWRLVPNKWLSSSPDVEENQGVVAHLEFSDGAQEAGGQKLHQAEEWQ